MAIPTEQLPETLRVHGRATEVRKPLLSAAKTLKGKVGVLTEQKRLILPLAKMAQASSFTDFSRSCRTRRKRGTRRFPCGKKQPCTTCTWRVAEGQRQLHAM
eukprot:6114805-Amphidinium_carterae.1